MLDRCGTLVGYILVGLQLTCWSTPVAAFHVVVKNDREVRLSDNTTHYRIHKSAFDAILTPKSDSRPSDEIVLETIQDSFKAWEQAGGVDLHFVYDGISDKEETGNDDENTLIWIKREWNSLPFAAPYVLAVTVSTFKNSTSQIIDSDIHCNNKDYSWAIIDPTEKTDRYNYVDVSTILSHEMGHFMGLDHSSEDSNEATPKFREAIMYYASYPGAINRLLKDDDIAAVKHLYGTHESNVPQINEIYPNTANNTEIVSLEISGNGFGELSLPRLYNRDNRIDIIGVVDELSDDHMIVSFNLMGQPPGDYDVAVNNSYHTQGKLDGALHVDGDAVEVTQTASNSSGCGVLESQNYEKSPTQEGMVLLLMLLGTMALIQHRWKFSLVWQPIRKSLFRR
jgi:hypothetical protein